MLNGAIWGGGTLFLVDVFMQWREHSQRNEKFTLESFDGMRALRQAGKGAIIGVGVGLCYHAVLGSDVDYGPFNQEEFLYKILDEETIRANPMMLAKVRAEQQRVTARLQKLFGQLLIDSPTSVGSMSNDTALVNSDSDIVLPFRRSSYATLSEMYDDAYKLIESEFSAFAEVRKNSRTIGITYVVSGHTMHFDIIPGREIENYHRDKKLTLYKRPDSWFGVSGWRKTNITAQTDFVNVHSEGKRITSLLKIYRNENGLNIPSIVIQNCVLESIKERRIDVRRMTWKNLERAMEFLLDSLSSGCVLDRANYNNNLLDRMTSSELERAIEVLTQDWNSLKEDPRHIHEMFTRYSH